MGTQQAGTDGALVVLVPEVEELVATFRAKYDPSAAQGMPAHITVLYPFRPAQGFVRVREYLQALFCSFQRFHFELASIERFPSVLYLAPKPAEPLRDLIRSAWDAFPESPPYGGAVSEPTPHVTVADFHDAPVPPHVEQTFSIAASRVLPIDVHADVVTLMLLEGGWWKASGSFPLVGPA
jgi:2'-5' RNA ligase